MGFFLCACVNHRVLNGAEYRPTVSHYMHQLIKAISKVTGLIANYGNSVKVERMIYITHFHQTLCLCPQ